MYLMLFNRTASSVNVAESGGPVRGLGQSLVAGVDHSVEKRPSGIIVWTKARVEYLRHNDDLGRRRDEYPSSERFRKLWPEAPPAQYQSGKKIIIIIIMVSEL